MGFKDRFRDLEPIADTVNRVQEETTEVKETQQTPIFDNVKRKLSDKIYGIPVWFEYSEDEKAELIKTFVGNYLKDSDISLSQDEQSDLVQKLLQSVFGFGETDLLISDSSITTLTIRENSPVVIERNNKTLISDIVVKQMSLLCNKLLKLSGIKSEKAVVRFGFRNLIITMILPPVSEPLIMIKKKNRETTDFEYLLQNNIIDVNIYSFLISLINDKKNILISGKSDSGKTSYIEAFTSAIPNYTLLLENGVINSKSFLCANLSDDEFENLIDVVNTSDADYIICDLNNGFFNIENKSLISTLRADSPVFAVTKLAGNESAKRKLTEKQAKSMIASKYDYIIQLDNDLFISSIAEFSTNKAGSLVMTEILKRSDNVYTYDFPEVEEIANESRVEEQAGNTFTSRFK